MSEVQELFTLSTAFSMEPGWLKELNRSACGFLLQQAVRAVRASHKIFLEATFESFLKMHYVPLNEQRCWCGA